MDYIRTLEQIKSIAQIGKSYSKDQYDLQRYQQLTGLVEKLTSELMSISSQDLDIHLPLESGYRTPKIDVRGVVFREQKILLCKERDDGLWTLPGGWADIGVSPAENVQREVLEETGFEVKCTKLIAVFDRDRHAHPKMLSHVYKLFFMCEILGGFSSDSLETESAQFFEEQNIPPLSTARVTIDQIVCAFRHLKNPDLAAEFD